MPPTETPAPVRARSAGRSVRLHGWGGGPGVPATVVAPRDADEIRDALTERPGRTGPASVIPRGMGRSYGDAAQRRQGLVIETRGLRSLQLDSDGGVLTAQAGATVGEILDRCVPAGWTLPVVPGTQHVTVGGAIAADVHGKNHGTAGTFGGHVEGLGLLTASGEQLELGPADALFQATVGGMGLTGIVTWARIKLRPVRCPWLLVDTDRVTSLDEAFAALRAPGGPHRVGWLDVLGGKPVRGVITRAEFADAAPPRGRRAQPTVQARATIPERWPAGILRPATVAAHNELRFRASPRRGRGRPERMGPHLFPLDVLSAWPRLYGPLGFIQYQFLVPPGRERVLETVIELLRRRRIPSFLVTLKDLGEAGRAPLSFPTTGWTLTLDIPRRVPGLEAALDECDELVVEAGGRIYLAKDHRLRPEVMRAMYPRLEEWRSIRDAADPGGVWGSDLAVRAGLVAD